MPVEYRILGPLEGARSLVCAPLEPLEVEGARLETGEVAGPARLDRLLAKRLPET